MSGVHYKMHGRLVFVCLFIISRASQFQADFSRERCEVREEREGGEGEEEGEIEHNTKAASNGG